MKRSGNHAIIDWMRRQAPALFYNNIIPIRPILEEKSKIPPPVDFDRFLTGKVGGALARAFHWRKHVIVNLEDHFLDTVPFCNVRAPVINILILRDPRNLFASRIKRGYSSAHPAYPVQPGPLMDRALALWKAHAKEFLGDTQTLDNRITISLESWFTNIEYRTSIISQLGFKLRDNNISHVSRIGGGSSFDGVDYDGQGTRMQVLKRADQLESAEKAVLNNMLRDFELASLSARYNELHDMHAVS